MRQLLLLALATSACVAHPKRPAVPTEYACSDYSLVRNGAEMKSTTTGLISKLSWRDADGEHFVAWPQTPTDRDAIEIVVPVDPMQDATQRNYDTTFGSSTADWRMTHKQVCTARGGYNDILVRYVKGETLDHLAEALSLDSRDDARVLLRMALTNVQRRYLRDH
jgi:hypothetical protein